MDFLCRGFRLQEPKAEAASHLKAKPRTGVRLLLVKAVTGQPGFKNQRACTLEVT